MMPQDAQHLRVGDIVTWPQVAGGVVTNIGCDTFTIRWDDGLVANYLCDDAAAASIQVEGDQ